MHDFTEELKRTASELGFVLSGVSGVEPRRLARFHAWLDAGFAGEMHYLADRRQAYADPSHVLDGCQTILMLAVPYSCETDPLLPESVGYGTVARYARSSRDYHDVIHERLKALRKWILSHYPQAAVRGVVDTAPLLEREFAEAAGLGWVGKNTLLLNRTWGSYFFLAALLTDLPLIVDNPSEVDHCGSCRACLDACPTQAFPEPYVLDATKCISYLTIEHRDHISSDLQDALGEWIFGCDICQEVCPWNRKRWRDLGQSTDADFDPVSSRLDIVDVLSLTEAEFRSRFRHTPMWRSRRRGLLRNAALAAGNQRLEAASESLRSLLSDPEPILRASAAWALSKIKPADWEQSLKQALAAETDATVSAGLATWLDAEPNASP